MQKVMNFIVNGIQELTGILFLTLFFLNLLRITLRYFLGISWLWVPDFSRLLFIWIVFLGTTVLYARGAHLEMDYVVNKLRESSRAKLRLVLDVCLAIFLVVLCVKGVEIARVRMRIPFDTWDFPTGYAYSAVPVCSGLMLIMTIERFVHHFSERRKS